jgi:alkyl hydroperoxide reductase subunit AhpC
MINEHPYFSEEYLAAAALAAQIRMDAEALTYAKNAAIVDKNATLRFIAYNTHNVGKAVYYKVLAEYEAAETKSSNAYMAAKMTAFNRLLGE